MGFVGRAKLLRPALFIFVLLCCEVGKGQPALEARTFEYVWQKDPSRVILALNDSAKVLIKNSFVRAIQNRWSVTMPQISMSVRPLPLFATGARLKTQLKDKQRGHWYLFLQVFDQEHVTPSTPDDPIPVTLQVSCKLITGTDSIILDRALTIPLHQEAPPADQVLLSRIPFYPADFFAAFDTIATWLFAAEPPQNKLVTIKPACVYQEKLIREKLLNQLSFKRDADRLQQIDTPAFAFHISYPTYDKIATHKNKGGNTASGALTLLTGVGTSKTRLYEYRADFALTDDEDSHYNCGVRYMEKVAAERQRERNDDGSYSMQRDEFNLLGRYVDPAFLNVVTLNKDTLATYSLRYDNAAVAFTGYHQLWDGSNDATIMALPADWNNRFEEKEVILTGRVEGDFFTMKTSKETRIKEFYVNDQLVTVMVGKSEPFSALIFHPPSMHQLKLFTILSLLPYSYFNVR